LGFQLSQDGWAPNESKVAAIVEWPAPETVKHLRSSLGMANFSRTFIPVYSEMAAPLTELLKNTKGGSQNLEWSEASQTAFMSLKAALTSAPVLRHFDPTLRTAVHLDGSQNAVGAVLLQWQEGEENPRHVAYMSRKLKGAQYRYDARNVEAFAAQMVLQTWRTLLLGQKFEIHSDHDSLQYLFTQKSPSQRILHLCEFLADFDFEEIKYVPGSHNLVPDFLSRPWDGAEVDVPLAIHTLAACTSRRTKKTAGPMSVPSVVVMPEWHGSIAVQEKHQRNGLWSVTIGSHETSHDGACRAIRTLVQEEEVTPRMTCVAHTNGVSLWRADFSGTHRPTSLNNPCQWLLPANLPPRKRWYRPHFEVLTYFGVWGAGANSTVFNSLQRRQQC